MQVVEIWENEVMQATRSLFLTSFSLLAVIPYFKQLQAGGEKFGL